MWTILTLSGGFGVARFGEEFWFLVLARADLFLLLAIVAARIVVFGGSETC
jgi:hypothetical protein